MVKLAKIYHACRREELAPDNIWEQIAGELYASARYPRQDIERKAKKIAEMFREIEKELA